MSLMNRIKVFDWLKKSQADKIKQITALQFLRVNELELARTRQGRSTKSAKRNLEKRGKKPKDQSAELIKLLQQNPEMIKKLQQMIN